MGKNKKKERKTFTGYIDTEVHEYFNYSISKKDPYRHSIYVSFITIPYCVVWRNGEFKKDRKARYPVKVMISIYTRSMKRINIHRILKNGFIGFDRFSPTHRDDCGKYFMTITRVDELKGRTREEPNLKYTMRLYANDIEEPEFLKFLLKTKEEKELDKP